jgi:hypothetical protein
VRAAAVLLAALLILPQTAAAVMMEPPGGAVPGEPPLHVLTLEEQRELSRVRAREAAPAAEVPRPADAPRPSVEARRPGPAPLGTRTVLLVACAALVTISAFGVALKIRLGQRAAAATGKPPAAEPEGSTVESLWRMHLRRRR